MQLFNQIEALLNQFQAGKEAYSDEEQGNLFQELNSIIPQINTTAKALDNDTSDLLNDLLETVVVNGFAFSHSHLLNTDVFFDFGTKLLASPNHPLIHNYLDVFRHSGFLKQIYNQQDWPDLIENLISKSNFTVHKLIRQRVKAYAQKTVFRVLESHTEKQYSWKDIHNLIHQFSLGLLGLVQSGQKEKPKIAFLVENSLNMVTLDLACLTTGIVNVMIPANSVPEQVEFILNQTKAQIILLGDDKQLAKVKAIKSKIPTLQKVVLLSGSSIEEWVISLEDLLLLSSAIGEERLLQSQNMVRSEDLASIMYTSGTTGLPKGIMFSHLNIVFKRFSRAMALPDIGQQDRFLAYLPLYHTFGRWLEMMGTLFWGAEYAFMENPAIATMLDNMARVRPTVFISIPKKWMQLYEHIAKSVNVELDDEEKIRKETRKASGGELLWGLSAAGYLEPDVFRFFQRNGIHLMSGFGMTEATGGITMTDPDQYIDNSLGRPLPGIQVMLADDGEMLIRGGYVMMGYYGMAADQSTFEDEWFPTGDIMRQYEDGHYEIVDRKKDIYKNIKGETIAPQKSENLFRDFEYAQQVFLVGDHKPFNTVLILPNYNHPDGVLKKMNAEEIQNYFSSVVVTVNKFLAPFERILDFRLIDRAFDAKQGELTPKGTYKRRAIEQNFKTLIQSMYEKNYISVQVNDFEVRIPNWFLREKGCLTSDLHVGPQGISLPKYELNLTIQKMDPVENLYQIGGFIYRSTKPFIDFQIFLANPFYWLGNRSLIEFAGESIFQWYRLDDSDPDIEFAALAEETSVLPSESDEFEKILVGGEKSLFGLNLAIKHFICQDDACIIKAISYFNQILSDEIQPIYPLIYELIQQPAYARNRLARKELFRAGIGLFRGAGFELFLERYLAQDAGLLDQELITGIVKSRSSYEDLNAIHRLIKKEVLRRKPKESLKKSSLPGLFALLVNFGILHPTKYKRVRQLIVRYQLRTEFRNISVLASMNRQELLLGFRKWLGENQSVSVDVETGEEYQWKDVVIFEESISTEKRRILLATIATTSLLREAIFLFSNGNMVRLYDIPPGGVWVSELGSSNEKSSYRISVQTRYQGSYDFVLNHLESAMQEDLVEQINWLIHAGAPAKGIRLLEDFGGLWRENKIWTEDYYPGDTVARFFERSMRRDSEENRQRLFHIWPFFVRTAIAAHVNFWRRTGYTLDLQDKSIGNIVVPPHDYQTGMRIISIADRRKTSKLQDLLEDFCRVFILKTQEQYPFIEREHIHYNIFYGILDSEGREKGLQLLRETRLQLSEACSTEITAELDSFLEEVKQKGFIPRQMHFAINRFHRWFHLNRKASLSAQAQSLNEMYDTYQLHDLEKNFPETRTRFFLETVFRDSRLEIYESLTQIMHTQHEQKLSQEAMLAAISNVPKEHKLTEKEEYFLSRLSYPHLKPTDSVLLFASQSITDVVVSLEDYEGGTYLVRKPVTPKEISRLHKLFLEANLPVTFNPDHRFMVAISERGFVIGGLFYKALDSETVYMEKIVVSSTLRRKGISDGLMREFFNRLRDEKIKNVTTGFFRPEYFYRFGFKVERKYAGLVRDLTKLNEE